ncbi:MAG: hypothetical protein ABUT20_31200 [Bacteroidota bacterium]
MLPFSLKIILGILVVLIILLFVVKNKRPIWLLIILSIGLGAWLGISEYNRTNKDISHVNADVKIMATDLIRQYEANDSLANKKYLGKIIETGGNVKDLKKDDAGYYTVVLGDATGMSSVRCSMDSAHHADAALLTPGTSATVRGYCTGFNKDDMGLGSDVILNRCVIVPEKN